MSLGTLGYHPKIWETKMLISPTFNKYLKSIKRTPSDETILAEITKDCINEIAKYFSIDIAINVVTYYDIKAYLEVSKKVVSPGNIIGDLIEGTYYIYIKPIEKKPEDIVITIVEGIVKIVIQFLNPESNKATIEYHTRIIMFERVFHISLNEKEKHALSSHIEKVLGEKIGDLQITEKKIEDKEREPIGKDIENLIEDLTNENNEDKWKVIVLEIFQRFGQEAVDKINSKINDDQLMPPNLNGIVSTQNSSKWNAIALLFLENGYLVESLRIFESLTKLEENNPATQNNYGVALLRAGKLEEAKKWFQKAFEMDSKTSPESAANLPASFNLRLVQKQPERTGEAVTSESDYYNIFFMDIVGFSKWYGTVQFEKISYLTDTVRRFLIELHLTPTSVPFLPTGDGMVLFFTNIEYPFKLARRLTEDLTEYNKQQEIDKKLEIRIGIHAGDSFPITDLHGGGNRCGPAINTTQRIMDLGKAGHILCSHIYGDRLIKLFGPPYVTLLHDCKEYTVKHGEKIDIYNIYDTGYGNKICPPQRTDV